MPCNEISLRVPGSREYVVVIRTALGGVAILKDFDIDTLDDLRSAADEACDCLLNQGLEVRAIEMTVRDCGDSVLVTLNADYQHDSKPISSLDTQVARAVLETLVPQLALTETPCGCISRIEMTLRRAAV